MTRWFIPFVLCFLLWAFLAGVWLHDWRVISGSLVAFFGVCAVTEHEVTAESFESRVEPSVEKKGTA
jgi:hypothetical protein